MSIKNRSIYEIVGLLGDGTIDQHYQNGGIFDPTQKIDTEQLTGTEKMRAILLNWCRDVLSVYFKDNKLVIDSAFLSVKLLFDYITFTLLNGRLNRSYIQLIGCVCLFFAIKLSYYFIGKKKEVESDSFQLQLLKKFSHYTDNSYTFYQIFELINCMMENNDFKSFLFDVNETQLNYIKLEQVKINYSSSDDLDNSEEYKSPMDKKWETFVREINHAFITVMRKPTFIRLLRLKSLGMLGRMSDNDLISHPILNEMFEVMIECANEIMEQVVFNVFNHRFTKNLKRRMIFAFTCLLIAIQQQGSFDWVYDTSEISNYFALLLSYDAKKINNLEINLLTLTNWKGCLNIENRIELKNHKDALLQMDKIFEFGKTKNKNTRKSLKKNKKKNKK